jgi:hypothetical protein
MINRRYEACIFIHIYYSIANFQMLIEYYALLISLELFGSKSYDLINGQGI